VDEPVATENSDAAPAEASVDAVNGKVTPTEDSQMGSGEKPAAEAAVTEAPPQEGGVAPGQETSRIINVPNNKVGVLIGKS
ncbi:hypothetical protein DKP78_24310, partial [Enterococcus faecium]